MRALISLLAVPLIVAALAGDAAAQTDWAYRGRVTIEADGTRAGGATGRSTIFVVAADSSWDSGGRVKLAGGLVASGSSKTSLSVQAREAYARISTTSWMDLEAGKRLVRWGVGYGYSPAGVLDPPRVPTDPSDRLGRNEGMPLARADLFRGDTSLTVAVASPTLWRDGAIPGTPSRLVAARLRTVLAGGLEVAVIGSAAGNRRLSGGGTVTHVIGQRLEWHGEVLVHDRGAAVNAVAGLQYTLPGVNVVMEYHRRGPSGPAGGPAGHLLFVRTARAGADVTIAPELIVIRALDDGTWTAVAGASWTVQRRLVFYARAMRRTAPAVPRAGLPPAADTFAFGATVRF
jgi:hypothetical protein